LASLALLLYSGAAIDVPETMLEEQRRSSSGPQLLKALRRKEGAGVPETKGGMQASQVLLAASTRELVTGHQFLRGVEA
jgi:hypothetical protein